MTRRAVQQRWADTTCVGVYCFNRAGSTKGLEQPLDTGEDGRATRCGRERRPIIFAAYESAGTGRKVTLPFAPPAGKKPMELWLR